jgi:hypothetical protein
MSDSTMSIGAAAYHAARILCAISEEVKALKDIITQRMEEEFVKQGCDLQPQPWGEGTRGQRTPYVSARWFDIRIRSIREAPFSGAALGTVTLVFNFYTPKSPTETRKEALLFVCWMPRTPGGDDRWGDVSFVASELARYVPHSSGLVGYQEMPSDQSVQGQDWVYAVPLSDFCEQRAIETLVVDPTVALLRGRPPMEALGAIQGNLVRFCQPTVNA